MEPQKSHGDVQKAFSGRQELHTSCTETMTSGQLLDVCFQKDYDLGAGRHYESPNLVRVLRKFMVQF